MDAAVPLACTEMQCSALFRFSQMHVSARCRYALGADFADGKTAAERRGSAEPAAVCTSSSRLAARSRRCNWPPRVVMRPRLQFLAGSSYSSCDTYRRRQQARVGPPAQSAEQQLRRCARNGACRRE